MISIFYHNRKNKDAKTALLLGFSLSNTKEFQFSFKTGFVSDKAQNSSSFYPCFKATRIFQLTADKFFVSYTNCKLKHFSMQKSLN